MPEGTEVSGLESDGGDLFYAGGGGSGRIRTVRRPRRRSARWPVTIDPVRPWEPLRSRVREPALQKMGVGDRTASRAREQHTATIAHGRHDRPTISPVKITAASDIMTHVCRIKSKSVVPLIVWVSSFIQCPL
jgi:hypothetical protein